MESQIDRLLQREIELRDALSYARLVAYNHFTLEQKICINQERGGIFRAIEYYEKTGADHSVEPDRYKISGSTERAVEDLLRRIRSKSWKKQQEQGIL